MNTLERRLVLAGILAVTAFGGRAEAEGQAAAMTVTTFERAVSELRTTDDTWRRIAWRTCLSGAAREAREQGRPILLWALGGDPAGRC